MVAFVGSTILSVVMTYAIVWYAKRRPVDAPLSWGEAMVAGSYVFFLMFWVYGVVPHQWLTWADNELKWRSDAYLFGPGSTNTLPVLQHLPMNISKQVVRDLVAVGIYGIALAVHVAMWAVWQGRGEKAARDQKALEERTTTYGRPLVRNP